MIDPLGPDPNDPATTKRRVSGTVSEFDESEFPATDPATAELPAHLGPRVRHANYDSPEALVRPESAAIPESTAKTNRPEALPTMPVPDPSKSSTAASRPVLQPKQPAAPKSPAPTALAHPVPPKPGKLERAVGFARTMLPIVGNLLPLLEGNVVGAAANVLANRPGTEVNLKPLEEAIASLQSDQRALTFHTGEQKKAIRRLEDEFGALQEAVQKNASEQAELAEQVVKLAKRTSSFMRLVIVLLVLSILFSAALVVRMAYILRT